MQTNGSIRVDPCDARPPAGKRSTFRDESEMSFCLNIDG